jgi:hypothetical protein
MGRKSKIENHPNSNIIIQRLASGEEYSKIIEDFPGIRYQDLDYYADNKLHTVLSKSPELKAEIDGDLGNDTLAEIRSLKAKAVDILTQAEGAGDLKTALLGIREARGCLDSILKAEGWIQEQTINVNTQINLIQTPEWMELRTQIVNALKPFPEALEAVRNAIQ